MNAPNLAQRVAPQHRMASATLVSVKPLTVELTVQHSFRHVNRILVSTAPTAPQSSMFINANVRLLLQALTVKLNSIIVWSTNLVEVLALVLTLTTPIFSSVHAFQAFPDQDVT